MGDVKSSARYTYKLAREKTLTLFCDSCSCWDKSCSRAFCNCNIISESLLSFSAILAGSESPVLFVMACSWRDSRTADWSLAFSNLHWSVSCEELQKKYAILSLETRTIKIYFWEQRADFQVLNVKQVPKTFQKTKYAKKQTEKTKKTHLVAKVRGV